MQKLAKREEEIMQACWKLGKAFIKEIIAELPDPRPHYNSVATMVRILEEKGFLNHETFGNTFQYFPVVSKEVYQNQAFDDIVRKYSTIPIRGCWRTSRRNKKYPGKS